MCAETQIHCRNLTLGDGTPARVRLWQPEDAEKLIEGFNRLSEESRIRRFLCQKFALTPQEFRALTHPDGSSHIALLAAILDANGQEVDKVAVARCFRGETDPETGEIAVAVIDEWQGLGLGRALIEELALHCARQGIRHWKATLFIGNTPMRRMLQRVGRRIARQPIDAAIVEDAYELRSQPEMTCPTFFEKEARH